MQPTRPSHATCACHPGTLAGKLDCRVQLCMLYIACPRVVYNNTAMCPTALCVLPACDAPPRCHSCATADDLLPATLLQQRSWGSDVALTLAWHVKAGVATSRVLPCRRWVCACAHATLGGHRHDYKLPCRPQSRIPVFIMTMDHCERIVFSHCFLRYSTCFIY